MVLIAGSYHHLGDYTQAELFVANKKSTLEDDGLTKCYALQYVRETCSISAVHYMVVTTMTVSHVHVSARKKLYRQADSIERTKQ
jgi:hypothetical protein